MACPNFFCSAKQERQGEEENFQGHEHAVPPEIPQGPEHWAEQAEKQHRAPQGPDDHVHPQLPVPEGQGEVEQGGQHREGVEAVQHTARPSPQHQAEGAEQVVEHPQSQPQEDGGQKGGELLGEVDPHQPNSRPNSRDLP